MTSRSDAIADDATPAEPRWRVPVAALAVGTFAVGTDAFVVAGVLPDVASSLRVDTAAAGQLVTVFALAYALLAPVLATATAGWSRRRVLLAALVVFAVGNALTALAPTYPLVLGTRVVAAGGAALYTATASATAAALAGNARRGRAIAAVMLGITASLVLGTPLGTVIASATSWRTTMVLVGGLGLLSAVGVAAGVPALHPATRPSLGDRLAPLRERRTLHLLGITVLTFTGIYLPYTYISAVFAPVTDGHGHLLALLLLLFGITATAGNLVAGHLADRIGPAVVVITALAALTVLFALMPLATATAAAAIPIVLLSGWISFSVTTPQQHMLVDAGTSATSAAMATSLYQSVLYLAVSLSGVLGAVTIAVAGAARIPWVAAGFVLVAGVWAWCRRPARR